jgi:hypothetical protein
MFLPGWKAGVTCVGLAADMFDVEIRRSSGRARVLMCELV